VYVSSARAVPYREGGSHAVGVFLGELTEPLEPMVEAGYRLTFVSPDGEGPHLDHNSFRLLYWRFSKKKLARAQQFYREQLQPRGIDKPLKLSDLLADPAGLEPFDSLFVPGGHAPMTDILYRNWLTGNTLNADTGRLLQHFHDRNKVTALICHAPAVLASAPEVDGRWLYEGYAMTCVSMLSEFLIEEVPPFKVMQGHLPDYPERLLRRRGARLRQQLVPMLSHVVEDRELITGQDPYAAVELGRRWKIRLDQAFQNKP
jgi:putative intracellular protease/amidase